MTDARLTVQEIDGIAYTRGPGEPLNDLVEDAVSDNGRDGGMSECWLQYGERSGCSFV